MKHLYIELTDQSIAFGILHKKNNICYLEHQTNITLSNHEIYEGKLFNLDAIVQIINHTIATYHLRKPSTIICMQSLTEKTGIEQRSTTLQIALCVSKAKLVIERIIGIPIGKNTQVSDLENSYDFLTPFKPSRHKHFTPLTLGLCTSLGLIFSGLLMLYNNLQSSLVIIKQDNTLLCKLTTEHQQKIVLEHQAQESAKKIAEKASHLAQLYSSQENPCDLISAIAQKAPKTSWLTAITIGHDNGQNSKQNLATKREEKKQLTPIKIEGITPDINEITGFIKSLSKTPYFDNPTLASIKKMRSSNKTAVKARIKQNPFYAFIITCNMKP
jgi:Tfp pilus assembly protein PilN